MTTTGATSRRYEKVQFKIIKNEAARMAALLSGDVDAIEQPPTADLARLKKDPKFTLTSKISHRVIYFNFDHLSRVSPFVTAKDGKPLDKNPLQDVRVRRAISKAINRPAIAERVMEGQAIPSGQLVSEKLFGHNPALKAEALRPGRRQETARRGRLSRWLQPHDSRTVRALRQRREDRAGRRADACRGSASLPRSRPRRWDRTRAAPRSRNSASTWWAGVPRPARRRRRCARSSPPSTATRDWAPSTGAAIRTPRSTT